MNERIRYYVDRDSFFASGAVYFMGMAIFERVAGCWGLWGDASFLLTQILLPIVCCLCIIVYILLMGKHLFELTIIPVVLGAVFFIVRALSFGSMLKTVLCILLYIVIMIVYVGVVFGVIRSKWWLVPAFGLPFLYRLLVVDIRALQDTANPVSFADGSQEMSVLCMLLAMVLLSLAMKKKPSKHQAGEVESQQAAPTPAAEEVTTQESQTESDTDE